MQQVRWDEPGCEEVAKGVHRIPLPLPNDGLRAVNIYVIEEGDHLVAIDGGQHLPQARQALEAGLAELGAELGDLRRFLVTHIHRDHYTQAVALRREFGPEVLLGAGERESLERATVRRGDALAEQRQVLLAAGAAELVAELARLGPPIEDISGALYEPPDVWVEEGQEIELASRRLVALATPGHTRGHVVYLDPDHQLLFAGDHVLPHITPSIGFEPIVDPDPLGAYLRSLARVRSLPDGVCLPAHGQPMERFHVRVDELLAHHDHRLDECARSLEGGAATAWEVARTLRWTRRERRLGELDLFNQMLAVMETRFHLELLLAQGRVRAKDDDGVRIYHQVKATAR